MKPDQERVRHLLTDTVTLLCKNGLNYQKELRVQGLLGITLDDSDVFVVHINETFGDLIGGAISVHADDDNTGQQTVANIDNEMELGKLEDNATMTVCRKKKDRDRSSDSSNSPAPSSEGTPNAQEIQRRPIKRLMTNLSSNTSRFEKRALLSSSKMNTTVERSAEMDAGQTHLDLDVKVKQERSGDDLQSYGDHVQMVSSYPTLSLSEVQGHYQTMDDVGDPGGGGEVPQRRNITQGSYDDSMSASAPQTGSYMLGSESCMQESVWDSAQMSAQGSGYAADGQSIVDPSCSSWDASQSAAASTQAVSATEPSADSLSCMHALDSDVIKSALTSNLVSPVLANGDHVRAFRIIWRISGELLEHTWRTIVRQQKLYDDVVRSDPSVQLFVSSISCVYAKGSHKNAPATRVFPAISYWIVSDDVIQANSELFRKLRQMSPASELKPIALPRRLEDNADATAPLFIVLKDHNSAYTRKRIEESRQHLGLLTTPQPSMKMVATTPRYARSLIDVKQAFSAVCLLVELELPTECKQER